MNVKERIEQIQKMIDQLQWDINSMTNGFRYYDLMIYNFSENPLSVFVLKKDINSENAACAQWKIDLLDLCYISHFQNELNLEIGKIKTENAPQEQIDEFLKIREMLGV
jgi:hypothetical protein